MSGQPLLSVEDVHASYGKSQVLRGVSLAVERGEVVALMGRNGAGKTTTLRTITGVLAPSRGRIVFDGDDVTGLPEHEISQRGVSYVAEERSIFPDLTVAENLRMGQVRGGDAILTVAEVYDLLPRLEERRSLPASNLSGGEQQMLVIARALLGRTELLLLDEPTEGLAPQIVERVLEVVEHIREADVPILLVEQNLDVALETADRGYIIDQGVVVYDGTTDDLEDDEQVQREYLGVGQSLRR